MSDRGAASSQISAQLFLAAVSIGALVLIVRNAWVCDDAYITFRVLDNFNVPLGAGEGGDGGHSATEGLRSSTAWTSASDTRNRVIYYHTQHNRRVRKIDLNRIDFGTLGPKIVHIPLDRTKAQDIEDMTPD